MESSEEEQFYELKLSILLPESYDSHITSISSDGYDLNDGRHDLIESMDSDVDPPMPVALLEKIKDNLYGFALADGIVHRFSLHSEKQDDDVLITDYFVKDGEVVPEEEFESFEIDDSAQEQFVRIILLCNRLGRRDPNLTDELDRPKTLAARAPRISKSPGRTSSRGD